MAFAAAVVAAVAVGGTMAGTQVAVKAKESAMPRAPLCASGGAADEAEPEKALAVDRLDATAVRYADVFTELPSPGHFSDGYLSVDGCGGTLVDVTAADAYSFYERVLPTHGWTIIDRAPGRTLEATRDDLTVRVGADEVGELPSVEVYRTGSQ